MAYLTMFLYKLIDEIEKDFWCPKVHDVKELPANNTANSTRRKATRQTIVNP